MLKNALLVVLLGMAGLAPAGCGEETAAEEDTLTPRLAGLSTTKLSVGETVFIVGENFLDSHDGHTELVFDGTFRRDSDGKFEQARFTVTPLFEGTLTEDSEVGGVAVDAGMTVLRLSRFGPFEVPFTASGDQTGTFSGNLLARNVHNDGTVYESSEPLEVALTVRPSIIIRKLEPFVGFDAAGTPRWAGCGAPALRAIQKLPYVLEVEAVGFEPDFFIYDLYGVNGETKAEVTFSHKAAGRTDRLGDPANKELVVFNGVPEDLAFYYAAIRVTGTVKGSAGEFVETALPLSVHRALEFHLDMEAPVTAQTYEPVPMSGCMPGAIGSEVTYAESVTEFKQNSVSVTVATSWSGSHGVSDSSTWNEGIAETSSVSNSTSENWSHSEGESTAEAYGVEYNHSDSQSAGFSSEDGENWDWSYGEGTTNEQMQQEMAEVYGEASTKVNVEVGAEGSIPGFAKVSGKVGTEVGATVGAKTGQTVGSVQGQSSEYGASMGGNHSQSEQYGSTTTDSVGESINKSYALSSSDEVGGATTKTEATSTSKVYDFGGAHTTSDVVVVGDSEAWNQTWTESTAHTTVLSYQNRIPVGKYGVWYRQTTRLVRKGYLYSNNLCGVRDLMGESVFNEWIWAAALAIGDECGAGGMPAAPFGAAQCIIAPCY